MGAWPDVADQNPLIDLVRKPGVRLLWSRPRDRLPAPEIFGSMKFQRYCDHGEVAVGEVKRNVTLSLAINSNNAQE
jgi:hypothetical protein